MKRINSKALWLVLAALLFILAAAGCYIGYKSTAALLLSQSTAERWQGENETAFAQISCFASEAEPISEEEIYKFRADMLAKLQEASFEVSADTPLIHDAYCAFGKANVARGQRKGEVSLIAIGGSYFDFHPIRLISGSYLSPDDLMEDRVLLDRETAWLLFGGEELAGMDFEINGLPFVVAGVIEREDDRFSRRAYDDGMGIYMHYAAYKKLDAKAAISCYELVMAEPVKGFVYSAAAEKFPIGSGKIVDNSHRFDAPRLWHMLKTGNTRSMHLGAAIYPYWENAARAAEDACLVWLCASVLMALLPIVLLIWLVIKSLVSAKRKLQDEYIPRTVEKLSEAHRIRARRRWEKKHNKK